MPYTYDYPRPSVTTDAVVFGVDANALRVLLIERKDNPFKGRWALPGGFVKMKESLEEGVARELYEEAKIKPRYLEQLGTFGEPKRDPRGRVITVAYLALVNVVEHAPKAGSDAKNVKWFDVDLLPDLAFDHWRIFQAARARLRAKVRYAPIGFELMPEKFTLSELQRFYEIVSGGKFEKRNFRKKVLWFGYLKEVGSKISKGRGAVLYSFDRDKYERLEREGFNFEI